jgi:2-oxoisovalerate dehydrogenase E2 component (dihydrolipoyl transacylase)
MLLLSAARRGGPTAARALEAAARGASAGVPPAGLPGLAGLLLPGREPPGRALATACAPTPCAAPAAPLVPPRRAPLSTSAAARAVREFRLAQTGEGIKECELVHWFVAEGAPVEPFERVCEVQSDKASIEITSPFAGVVRRLRHAPGALVQVGDVLAEIDAGEEEEGAALGAAAGGAAGVAPGGAAAAPAPAGTSPLEVLASPAVRARARELGVALAAVAAAGSGGRVTREHLEAFAAAAAAEAAAAAAAADVDVPTSATAPLVLGVETAAPAAAAGLSPPLDLRTTTLPLRGYRRAMARAMGAAASVPHFHLCDEARVDALLALRARLAGAPALAGAKLTFLPFFVKAAAAALAEHPELNASLAPGADALLLHGAANVGVAVATPRGLVVPNVKDCGARSVGGIARELARIGAAAAAGALAPEDLAGTTFTVSNVGSIGGTYGTPLPAPPTVAILAIGRARRVPWLPPGSDAPQPAHVVAASLGADHRAVDGAALASFLRRWRALIEEPGLLLLLD